jgi:hypothetical protein
MGVFSKLVKYGKAGLTAAKKAKADDVAAAAKKAKEAADKAEAAKKAKKVYEEGIKAGKKKGAKSAKRKMVAGAAAAGTVYYEGKTGNISKTIGEAYRTRNATKQTHTGAPVKAKAGMKEALQGPRGGVKEIVKKANSTSKKPTTTSKKSVKK